MEYEKYLEKSKNFVRKSTTLQRTFFGLLVLVILGAYIAFIDPSKKLLEMRNAQRRTDVVNILNAVYQYEIDNKGGLAETIKVEPTMICRTKAQSCEGLVDLSNVLIAEKKVLSKIPTDPKEKNPNSSGYQILRLGNGRISVSAPLAENNAVISLSK